MTTPNISRDNSLSPSDPDLEVLKHEIFKDEYVGLGNSNIMATNSSMYCLQFYVHDVKMLTTVKSSY